MTCTDCRAEGADCLTTDRVRVCFDCLYERVVKERDEARAEVERLTKMLDVCSSVHSHNVKLHEERKQLREALRTVAERQREACAKSVEAIQLPRRSWEDGEQSIGRYDGIEDAAEKVRATPLVTEGDK